MSRGVRIVAIAVLGSLLFAACSSSSSSGSGDTGSAATTTEAPASSASGGSSSSSGGSTGTFDSAQCQQAVTALANAGSQVAGAMNGGGGGDLQTSLDQLKAFADNAPEEIRADMQTVVAGYAAFAQAMADSGYDPSSGQAPSADQLAAIGAAAASLNTPEYQTASDNVSAWFQSNCGG